ncbi:MAG: MerR family transcriptional regulator [Cyanobacteria bacterium J06614_10]
MLLYKISAFSRLGQVSIKALRLYDQRGLLKPAKVDRDTGYRYYTVEQLPQLHRLLVLKAMGFSLEQIGQLIQEDLSLSQMQAMLRLKQAELQQQLSGTQERMVAVDAYLKFLEEERTMPEYTILLKAIKPIPYTLSVRDTIPTYPAVGRLLTEIMTYLGQQRSQPQGPCIAIWHDPEYKEKDVDAEAIAVVSDTLTGTERIKHKALPAIEQAATLIHRGPYTTLNQAYAAIVQWIEENGYQITGPNREVYLKGGAEQNNSEYITEIQFPVQKAA